MPCDTPRRATQSVQERVTEVREAIGKLDTLLKKQRVQPVVGPQGAITFQGWEETDKNGVTDACAYRRLIVSGSPLAIAEIARAEQLAGRAVDRKVVAQGVHSHDGGKTWHGKG